MDMVLKKLRARRPVMINHEKDAEPPGGPVGIRRYNSFTRPDPPLHTTWTRTARRWTFVTKRGTDNAPAGPPIGYDDVKTPGGAVWVWCSRCSTRARNPFRVGGMRAEP